MRIAVACVVALLLGSCAAADDDEAATTATSGPAGEASTTMGAPDVDEAATTAISGPATEASTTMGAPDAEESGSTTQAPPIDGDDCPEVVAVEMIRTAPGVFTVNTTVRSVDIEGVSYADAWEVRDLGGEVYGERILTHPHANEQPFTRSLSGVAIPTDVTRVEVAARDSVRGFCGAPLVVEVPHS